MNKILESWMNVWLYVMAAGGLLLIVLLGVKWQEFSWASRLAYLTIITLPFHVWEEWRFPAGFHYIYNLMWKSGTPDRYPMNRVSDMLTNFGALLAGLVLVIVLGHHPAVAIGLFFFCVAEVLAHTVFGVRAYLLFKANGKKTIYNPGLGTTYFMFLPLAIAYAYILAAGLLPTTLTDWLLGAAGSLGALIAFIVLPENLLKNKNTPYPFTGKYRFGYFKKYVK